MKKELKMFSDLINHKVGLYFLLFIGVILLFNDLSKPGLPSYDDCTKAQRAVEMLENGDWVTPHYAGKPNFDHPPLYFWGLAVSFSLFGKTEFAARLFGVLCGLLSIFIAYKLGETIKSREVGWYSGFFLSTSYMFLKLSRRVATDVPYMFFFSLALLLFIKGYLKLEAKNEKERKEALKYFIFYGLSVGISGMIKSVFVIFPLVVPMIYIFYVNKNS